jgi:hypothetical protein
MILRGLLFERNARYQSAAEFGDGLARALVEEPETKPRQMTPTLVNSEYRIEPLSSPVKQPVSVDRARSRAVKTWVAAASLIVLAFAGLLVFKYGGFKAIGTPASPPTRSMVYSLTVQRMRDGKPYDKPFESSGQETFDTGHKFRLNISTPEGGYIYLFNDGPPTANGTSLTILYPTPATNNGSAAIGPDQLVQTNWNEFSGQTGIENFWIIWSISTVPELEAAKAEAFKHPDGAVTGDTLAALRQYLKLKQSQIHERTYKDKKNEKSTVRAASDMLVKLVELSHR